jgi:ferredoxin
VETVADYKEIVDEIKANGGEAFNRCYQCGLCDAVCPWNRLLDFSMRKIVRQAMFGMTDIESEDIWRCTTCGRLPPAVPQGCGTDRIRYFLASAGHRIRCFPQSRQTACSASAPTCLVWATPWAKTGKRVPTGQRSVRETICRGDGDLIFSRLLPQLRPAIEKSRQATATILNQPGSITGYWAQRRTAAAKASAKPGNEDLFKRLARENIKTIYRQRREKILVSSPHCYHTFKNEYPEFMVNFEVVHISQYLLELIDAGRLELTKA